MSMRRNRCNSDYEGLFIAVETGDVRRVKEWLEKGNPDTRDKCDRTLLHYAAYRGRFNVARLLIDHGADVNAKDDNGRTPLHYATFMGYFDIVKLLIDHGADVNAVDRYGVTPLHFAARKGYLGIAKLLIEHGADCNAMNVYGRTPIDVAKPAIVNKLKSLCEGSGGGTRVWGGP